MIAKRGLVYPCLNIISNILKKFIFTFTFTIIPKYTSTNFGDGTGAVSHEL